MMSTRSTRRAPLEPDMGALTTRDRLIISQAVYELGDDWVSVANLLSKNQLLSNPKSFLTSQSCQSVYAHLVREAGLEAPESNGTMHAQVNLTLVKLHYDSHFQDLRTLILAEEEKYKAISTEIAQIRAGDWNQSDMEPKKEAYEAEGLLELQRDELTTVEEDDGSSDDEPLHTTRTRAARLRASTGFKPKDQKKSVTEGITDAEDAEMEQPDTPREDAIESGTDIAPARRSKRKASVLDSADILRDKKRAREISEPVGDDEAGSSRSRRRGGDPEALAIKRFQSIIVPLHQRITTLKDGNIFQSPIKASEAPDYRDIVKRPIDLRTIRQRVKDGVITNSTEYRRDIYLMFANAVMYNRPGSSVYRMTETMREESELLINDFRNTEATLMHRM